MEIQKNVYPWLPYPPLTSILKGELQTLLRSLKITYRKNFFYFYCIFREYMHVLLWLFILSLSLTIFVLFCLTCCKFYKGYIQEWILSLPYKLIILYIQIHFISLIKLGYLLINYLELYLGWGLVINVIQPLDLAINIF